MTARTDWRDDAACRDADPELFFPIGSAGPALRQIDEAKRICRACPAQTRCLAWALDQEVIDGVWGGTTEDERRVIGSRRRRMSTSQEDASHPCNHTGSVLHAGRGWPDDRRTGARR
jgi:WhiB family transcriptional regulator, redox-sensing transcriptional regulator